MARIKVELNSNRTLGGILVVKKNNGQQHGYGLSVLGKAAFNDAAQHGNPLAEQIRPYGDTPTGTYRILAVTNFGSPYTDTRKYGNQGVIKLEPQTGNALIARNNGRTGILIHGGDLGAGGQLRRTNGCLRMANDELAYLKQLINELSISDPVTILEVVESGVPNAPCFNNSTCGEGDPPPGF